MIVALHTACGFLALLLGLVVLWNPKGTLLHRRLGILYCLAMLVLNLTAFGIYRVFGRFGIFHVMAIVSLLTVLAGLIPVLFRRRIRQWLAWHYQFMAWSYAGLLAATANEAFVHIQALNQIARANGLVVLLAQVIILGGSATWINLRQKAILASYNPQPAATPLSEHES